MNLTPDHPGTLTPGLRQTTRTFLLAPATWPAPDHPGTSATLRLACARPPRNLPAPDHPQPPEPALNLTPSGTCLEPYTWPAPDIPKPPEPCSSLTLELPQATPKPYLAVGDFFFCAKLPFISYPSCFSGNIYLDLCLCIHSPDMHRPMVGKHTHTHTTMFWENKAPICGKPTQLPKSGPCWETPPILGSMPSHFCKTHPSFGTTQFGATNSYFETS